MKILHWKNILTGETGHGSPIEDEAAVAWIEPDAQYWEHWLEDVEGEG